MGVRLTKPTFWYVLTAVAVTLLEVRHHTPNNFLIFRGAAEHLLAGRDLYIGYPASYFDLYKYSPTFALLFLPFAKFSIVPALLAWNSLSAWAFARAVTAATPTRSAAIFALVLLWWPFVNAIRVAQSNPLVVALIIAAAIAMERRQVVAAAIAIAAGASIKLLPLAVAPLALMHARKRRFVAAGLASGMTFLMLPALVAGPAWLLAQLESWRRIQRVDDLDRGYSVMGMLYDWLGVAWPSWIFQVMGALVLLLPLALRRDRWVEVAFRRHLLASVLIYVVIFNHQAELQSYLIAATGLVIWFIWSRRRPLGAVAAATAMIALHPLPYLIAWVGLQVHLMLGSGSKMHEGNVTAGEALAHRS